MQGQDATSALGTAPYPVTIQITGTNDAPVVTSGSFATIATDSGTGSNAATGSLGTITATDVDANDTLTYGMVGGTAVAGNANLLEKVITQSVSWLENGVVQTGSVTVGSVFLNTTTGEVTYALADGAKHLGAGASLATTVAFTVTDGHVTPPVEAGTATFTINGINDAPTFTPVAQTWGENQTGSYTLLVSDADSTTMDAYSLNYTEVTVTEAPIGAAAALASGINWNNALAITSAGTLKFTPGTQFDFLAQGERLTITIPVTVQQGAHTVTELQTITITGTNDAPTVAAATASVTEDTQLTATGTLPTPTDIDANDTLSYVAQTNAAATYGTFSVDAAGNYTYSLNNSLAAVQGLGAGETLTDTITYTVSDGKGGTATNTLTVTINGTNDGPVFTSELLTNANVNEAGRLNWAGKDATEAATFGHEFAATATEVPLLVNGKFSVLDTDTNDRVTVTISSGSNTITFTTNSTGGDIQFASGASKTLVSDNGKLVFENGKFNFYARNESDMLASGKSVQDDFKVVLNSDVATERAFTITINGADDAPTFYGSMNYGTGYEEGQPTVLAPLMTSQGGANAITGTLRLFDIDTDDKDLGFTVNGQSGVYDATTNTYTFTFDHGTLTLKWDGTQSQANSPEAEGAWKYTYTADVTYANTHKFESPSFKMEIEAASEGHGSIPKAVVTVDCSYAAMDGSRPAIVADTLTFKDDGTTSFNGVDNPTETNVLANDYTSLGILAKGNSSVRITSTPSGSTEYGTWTMGTDGTFKFTLNQNSAAYKSLGEGEVATLYIPYQVQETGKTASTSYVKVLIEGINAAPEAKSVTVSVNADWLGKDISTDLSGYAWDKNTHDVLTFHFTGLSNVAVNGVVESTFSSSSLNIKEGFTFAPKNADGGLFVSNPDGTITQVVTAYNDGHGNYGHIYAGKYGWLVEFEPGKYKYVADQTNPTVIGLKAGQTLTENFTYSVTDDKGASSAGTNTITVKVNGYADSLAVKTMDAEVIRAYDGLASSNKQYERLATQDNEGNWEFRWGATRTAEGKLQANGLDWANGSGSAGQLYLADLNKCVQSLDNPSATFTFQVGSADGAARANTASLYGLMEDGTKVYLGSVQFSAGTSQLFWSAGWANLAKLEGKVLGLYTDANCTPGKELTVWATSSDGASTLTKIPVDIPIVFENDSPVVQSATFTVNGEPVDGRVTFTDVDTTADKLVLSVQDAAGNMVAITANNTQFTYSHGTLVINKDGTFTYTANPAGESGTIKIQVSDGNTATDGYLTMQGSTVPAGVIHDDLIRYTFTSDNMWNQAVSARDATTAAVISGGSLLGNDTGINKETGILNAGLYDFSKKLIVGKGVTENEWATNNPYRPTLDADKDGKVDIATEVYLNNSRYQVNLPNYSLSVATDGQMKVIMNPYLNFYDTETGKSFTLTSMMAELESIARDHLGYTEKDGLSPGQQLINDLRIHFDYQVLDSNTGEVLTGTAIIDIAGGYANNGQTFSGGLQGAGTSLAFSTAFNRTDNQVDTQLLIKGLNFVSDMTKTDTLHVAAGTLGADGKWVYAAMQSVVDLAGGQGNLNVPATAGNITVKDPSAAHSFETTLYTYVKLVNGVYTFSPTAQAGYTAMAIGSVSIIPKTLGATFQLGLNADGSAIYGSGCNALAGDISTTLFAAGNSAAMDAFLNMLRDMPEGQVMSYGVFSVMSSDERGKTGAATLNVSFKGTDVLIDDTNLNVGEKALLQNGTFTLAGFTPKHTVTTARTEKEGWDSENAAFTKVVQGQYGDLEWNSTSGKYEYKLHAGAAAQIQKMFTGQSVTETFNVTMVDTNGEHSSGRITVTVNGETTSLTNVADSKTDATEGTYIAGSIADIYKITDNATVTYEVRGGTSIDKSNPEAWRISTAYGEITFNSLTGQYVLVTNGTLQEGETASITLETWATITNGTTVLASNASDPANLTIEIHGVNDAPIIISQSEVMASSDKALNNWILWNDVDNPPTDAFTISMSHDGHVAEIDSSTSGYTYSIEGDHGLLLFNHNTGQYNYTLHDTIDGRVVDHFTVEVTDQGGATSAAQHLTIYGVDGNTYIGTDAADTLTAEANASHIFVGGKGNDSIDLTNSDNTNILVWNSGDQGDAAQPATDYVKGFQAGANGDMLDLRGLLADLKGGETLDSLLSFKVENNNTIIQVHDGTDNGAVVQQIVLEGVTLNGSGTLDELSQQVYMLTS